MLTFYEAFTTLLWLIDESELDVIFTDFVKFTDVLILASVFKVWFLLLSDEEFVWAFTFYEELFGELSKCSLRVRNRSSSCWFSFKVFSKFDTW